jgi:hypothetical protein
MSVPRGCRLQAAAAVVPSDGDAVSIFVRRETAAGDSYPVFTRSYGTHLYIIADNSFASNAMVISNGLSVIYVYSRPYSIVIIYYSCIYH